MVAVAPILVQRRHEREDPDRTNAARSYDWGQQAGSSDGQREMRKDVRIVLAGDDGVGKSTLITSLIKEAYLPRVQKVLPEVTLPIEVAPEGVITKISDTSCE